jgi:Ser/Thr protein kinase RdoA (MazF antagonist)
VTGSLGLAQVGSAELAATLERELSDFYGRPVSILELRRRPSNYRTSYTLEELSVTLADGETLPLMFKDLGPGSLSPEARRAKPAFLLDPMREIEVYRLRIPGTITSYGGVVDPAQGRYWLFLERTPGVELYQVGSFEVWRRLAGWLARLHDRSAADPAGQAALKHALDYNPTFYRLWLDRAARFLRNRDLPPPTREAFANLVRRYGEVVERLVELPRTVVHGEFFASNVLVQETSGGPRFSPIDWEMAAIAPGPIDLAALVAGRSWSEGQKRSMAIAYYEAATVQRTMPGWPKSAASFLQALDCCRLHLALQWIGWSDDWSPPPQHAQDWLGEALEIAERLDLVGGTHK